MFTLTVLVILAILVIVLVRALIPLAVGVFLLVVAMGLICMIFQGHRTATIVGIGSVFLVPGIIICALSKNGYSALISGNWVLNGPRPAGVLLAIIGAVILIFGIIDFILR